MARGRFETIGTLNTATATPAKDVSELETTGVQFFASTSPIWQGTAHIELSYDAGVTWVTAVGASAATNASLAYTLPVRAQQVRVVATAATQGNIICTLGGTDDDRKG